MHDELGQLLTSIRLEVAIAVEKFQGTRTAAEFDVVDRLQSTVGLVDLSIATVRRLTSALRPATSIPSSCGQPSKVSIA